MGITPKDIQDQRKLLERGERILEAQEQQAERARLRDTFAAAALTGLLVLNKPGHGQQTPDEIIRRAWRWADAMLQQRNTQQSQTTPGQCSTPRECTSEPVAWAVMYPNGELGILAFYRLDAECRATASDRVVPLYRKPQPTLTNAERAAVEVACQDLRHKEEVATLRGLLTRLS